MTRRVLRAAAIAVAAAIAAGCAPGSPPPDSADSLGALAEGAPRGTYPKYARGVASYWTAVGTPGGAVEALVNEEGMVEVAAGRFSLEPVVEVGDAVVTWGDVRREQSLVGDDLPMPVVTWRHPEFTLVLTAFVADAPGATTLWLRYRLRPTRADGPPLGLRLAVRPFQVLPPWQRLNVVGGVGRIDRIDFARGVLDVDGRTIATSPPPEGLGPPPWPVPEEEPRALRSWALAWPAGTRDVDVAAAIAGGPVRPPAPGDAAGAEARVRADWETRLDRVGITLPAAAADVAHAVRTTLGWILVDRDGPMIRPGPRTYARAWIRDGALTSSALLMLNQPEPVREFLEWYAPFQFPDGRVPCCVDARGADPTPENDSDGEFVYAVADYWRFTRDRATVHRLWPHVARAAEHIEALRRERSGARFAGTPMAGLVPESISHEGYAAHPEHSYWDDFFALRGLADAAVLAPVAGEPDRAAGFAAARDGLARAIAASVRRVITTRHIAFVPGSVELADFDPTSTAIAVTVAEAEPLLPPAALTETFARYVAEVARWRAGTPTRSAYTPYEARNAEALVRLGRRDDAYAVLRFVMDGRRPRGWNVWPEVIAADPDAPRFVGDMPHGWGGATVVRAVRTMLAYERDRDQTLVLAAGVPAAWLDDPAGVAVRALPTHWGPLAYVLRRTGARRVRLDVAAGVQVPPGGIVVAPPLRAPLARARVDGRVVPARADGAVVLRRLPAAVELEERR